MSSKHQWRNHYWSGDEMEEKGEIRAADNGGIEGYWYWGSAGAAQLWLANSIRRKGLTGHKNLLGMMAFGSATLYVGAFGCAIITTIQLSGIRSMEDMNSLAASLKDSRKST